MHTCIQCSVPYTIHTLYTLVHYMVHFMLIISSSAQLFLFKDVFYTEFITHTSFLHFMPLFCTDLPKQILRACVRACVNYSTLKH